LSNRPGKILLVTGVLAEETVKRYAKESIVNTETVALKIAVAALLTPEVIAKGLKNINLTSFDMILVPGLVRGDTKVISKAFGIETFKGPRYAADLPTVLDSLGEVKLSTVVPACDLLRKKLVKKALREIEETELSRNELIKKPGNIQIGNLAVGKDFPMRVLAEIVDAPLMGKETVQRLAKHFVETGASIIDVGMVAGESRPSDAKSIVQAIKQVVNVPVSIDSLDPAEIQAAVQAGADLVLSADAGNIEAIAPYVQNVAVVVIPTNQRQGIFPKKPEDRVKFIEEILESAKKLGLKKFVADLILEPSDVLASFVAFRQFADRNPDVPIFVGVSNVTELMDADSVGVNALLALLSSEVDASILLATEKSDKAKGTIAEEVIAAKMMFLAKKRDSVPKDLGVDLLMLKDKRNREEAYDKALEQKTPAIVAESADLPELDLKGSFTILLDRDSQEIVALHYPYAKIEKPDKIIKGKTAESVFTKVLELGLVSKLDHAAYLGNELAIAGVALRTGKEYIQDKPLFGYQQIR
jgi:dihydropteroate synthase-like protein